MPAIENKKIILFLGCLCIFFPGSFVFGYPGVMASEWQQMFGADKAQVGSIMFFILIGTGFSMYTAGRLQEIFATRHLVFAGALTCALSMFAVGFAQNMTHVYLWAFAEGFFCGFVYLPCLGFFQKLFPENKGTVSGILNLTFGGASAVMSPVYTWLYSSHGYMASGVWAGILALLFGTFGAFVIRLPGQNASGDRVVPSLTTRQIVKMPAFWFLWWVWALAGAAGVSMILLSSSFGQSLGYTLKQSVIILICFNLLNGLGRVVCGRLADRFPKTRVLQTVFFMAATAYLILPWMNHLPPVAFLACFIGLSFGALFTVSAPLVSEVFGLENFGQIFGMVFTAYGFVAGFIGPWMSGLILDKTGSFLYVFSLFAFFYLTAFILIHQVRRKDP